MEDDDRRTATGHLCQMVSNPPIPTTWSEGHPTLAHISDLDVRQTQASTIWNPSCVLSQASYVRMTQQNHVNWTTCSQCLFTVRHHLKHTHRNNKSGFAIDRYSLLRDAFTEAECRRATRSENRRFKSRMQTDKLANIVDYITLATYLRSQ